MMRAHQEKGRSGTPIVNTNATGGKAADLFFKY
jgi:hypothetical protein